MLPFGSFDSGVNLFGYLRAESGVGEHARTLLAVLDEAGVPVVPIDFGDTRSRRDHPLPAGVRAEPLPGRHLLCVNADQTRHFVERFGVERLGAAPRIGYWHWEVEEFPDWMAAHAELVDAVWTASRHSAEAIRRKVDRPVAVFSPAVDPPKPAPLPEGLLPAGPGPLFLTSFDYDSVLARKNPIGAIAAYRRAFPEGSRARLLVKSVNGGLHPELHRRVVEAAGGRADVAIVDRFLERAEQSALIHACDVFVSLHRAEGFGLMLAEAMAAEKPVIATAYSGNLEFMDDRSGILLPWRYVEIEPGSGPYSGRWAEPDGDAASAAMARLAASPELRRELGARASGGIHARHGIAARAARIRAALEALPARESAAMDSATRRALRQSRAARRRARRADLGAAGWLDRLRTRLFAERTGRPR